MGLNQTLPADEEKNQMQNAEMLKYERGIKHFNPDFGYPITQKLSETLSGCCEFALNQGYFIFLSE